MAYFEEITISDININKSAGVTSNRQFKTAVTTKLCGDVFTGDDLNSRYWSCNKSDNAKYIHNKGRIALITESKDDAIYLKSTVSSKFIPYTCNSFKTIAKFSTPPVKNNIRTIGALSPELLDGYFFRLNGNKFEIGTINTGFITSINNNFNGLLGPDYKLDDNYHVFEIVYDEIAAHYYIDDILLHTIQVTSEPLVSNLDLNILIYNINKNSDISSELHVISSAIVKHG